MVLDENMDKLDTKDTKYMLFDIVKELKHVDQNPTVSC